MRGARAFIGLSRMLDGGGAVLRQLNVDESDLGLAFAFALVHQASHHSHHTVAFGERRALVVVMNGWH